jgi:hypothetical protein
MKVQRQTTLRYTSASMTEQTQNPALSPMPRRRFGRLAIFLMVAFCLMFLAIGVFSLCGAFSPDMAIGSRLLFLVAAALTLWLPARIVWLTIHRKWTTGQWGPTEEERQRNRLKWINPKTPSWVRFVPPFLRSNAGPFWLDYDRFFLLIWTPLAILWIYSVFHHHLRGWDLVTPSIWVILAAQSIWSVVRKAKRAHSNPAPKN